jgi:hypothetical protein
MSGFNLSAALKGAPVKTRDGRVVTHFTYYPEAPDLCDRVVAFVEGVGVETYNENGQYYEDGLTTLDLVMAGGVN